MVKGLVEHLRQAAEGKRFPEPSLLRAAAKHLEILDRAAELEPPLTQASPSSPPQAQIGFPPGKESGGAPLAGSIEVDLIQEQASPRPGDGPGMWELVLADMAERDRLGRARYGTPLQAWNGRRPLVDAYQEGLDLVVYLRQELEERAGLEKTIANLERENELLREELAALERGCLACGAGPGRWCECS